MRRFYVPQFPSEPTSVFALPKDVIRHLATVLRCQAGYEFEIFDGLGKIALCAMQIDNRQAKILKPSQLTTPEFKIELIQGLAKGQKTELILQKGTELGLSKFILTATERSQVKINHEKVQKRTDRWQRIVHEACCQSGQPFAPTVEVTESLPRALENTSDGLKLMLWEDATIPLSPQLPVQRPTSISLLVGPEGGFSSKEAAHAQAVGFKTVRLGPRILRTETAGLAILSILQYVYGDLSLNESCFSSSKNGKEST